MFVVVVVVVFDVVFVVVSVVVSVVVVGHATSRMKFFCCGFATL